MAMASNRNYHFLRLYDYVGGVIGTIISRKEILHNGEDNVMKFEGEDMAEVTIQRKK